MDGCPHAAASPLGETVEVKERREFVFEVLKELVAPRSGSPWIPHSDSTENLIGDSTKLWYIVTSKSPLV